LLVVTPRAKEQPFSHISLYPAGTPLFVLIGGAEVGSSLNKKKSL